MIHMHTNKIDSDQVCNRGITKPYTNLHSVTVTTSLTKLEQKNYPTKYKLNCLS